ncbi:endospore germination permease [Vallitalea pronyensis]|uniref:Endospore germination permease n=1 Tax=Vallitalea pronyensis TaxID=1348613 RepID=A0A8J8MMX5_9FIRM|nr:endospore germination permease [Vallitalea pronyensis]QUI24411.1 endospore germination permease [Vallitalea pronyensis]
MKNVITNRQGMGLIVLIMSETLVLGAAKEAESDLWIALILALGVGVLFALLYSWILSQYPGKNLYDILVITMGRWLGSIIVLFYVLYSLYVSAYILIDFVVFTNTVGLEATPNVIIGAMVMVLVISALKKGIEVMGRWSEYFVIFILITSAITVILMFPMIEVNNLKPVLANGWGPVLESAYGAITFPFAEIIVFMVILNTKMIKKEKDIYRIFVGGLLIGGIFVSVMLVVSFVELGHFAYMSSYFPVYAAISRISIGEVLQRIEIIPAIAFIMGDFMKIALYVLVACEGVKKLAYVKNYKFIVTPICIFVLLLSLTMFDDIMDSINQLANYNYIANFMLGIIPATLAIITVIRTKFLHKNTS